MTIRNSQSVGGWSIAQLYNYFCSWFRAPSSAADQNSPSNVDAAYYNLGMQDQWQNLYQPAPQNDVQNQIDAEQEHVDEMNDVLDRFDNDDTLTNVFNVFGQNLSRAGFSSNTAGGGGFGYPFGNPYLQNPSGNVSQGLGFNVGNPYNNITNPDYNALLYAGAFSVNYDGEYDDVLSQYSFVYEGKVSMDANGKVMPQDTAKALFLISQYLQARKAESEGALNALRQHQDG